MAKELSRLGIFVFFDPQGIVDEYVVQLLQAFRPNFSRMVVISNISLDSIAQEILTQHSDALFMRENHGLDAAAFRDGLVNFCGWDEVEKYDEVVLINDTFFGPVHSFDAMFAEMAGRDLDFWGMSAGYPSEDGWKRVKHGHVPSHIQTFFVAFRKQMVCTDAFRSYWENYDHTMNDFISVVTQHEMVMTKHFEDLGFRWGIYADTEKYNSQYRAENFNLYYHQPHGMMRDMKFPVLKKKVLSVTMPDYLYMNDLENSADALDYAHSESDYDTKLIWDNVLRVYNITDLYTSLHLNYVLPSVRDETSATEHAALVCHISNPFFAPKICEHALRISSLIDVYIIPESKEIVGILTQCLPENSRITVLAPTRQQTPMGGFVLRCDELSKKYRYLGFVHDLQNPDHFPTTVPESTVYGILQNAANDPDYVTQILSCFERNPRLGVLGTPFPIHHYGFSNYGNEWGQWFDAVKALAGDLVLHCNLSKEKQPFMITGAFWCRTDALQSLWKRDWSAKQFSPNPITGVSQTDEVLKRILPYIAQSEGFYSGIVMHTNYASMRITGQQYMLDQIVDVTRRQQGCTSEFFGGYLQQLQAMNSGNSDAPMMVDLSQFKFRSIIRLYLERRTPRWLSSSMLSLYRFVKKILRRK